MADRTILIPTVALNTGHLMPVLGMGTATMDTPSDNLIAVFLQAIESGYRHFDTAAIYGTEKMLGAAIKEALSLGIIKSRDELFITSKLYCNDAHAHLVLPALNKSLSRLGLEYLDLYLIHWPLSMKPGELSMSPRLEDILPDFDMEGVWRAMEECQQLGLVKSIGVCNFATKKLSSLMSLARIPPAVNQVEMNVLWKQQKLCDFCNQSKVCIVAWGPLGASGTIWGSNSLMENTVLKDIAQAKGKTIAQVALRWLYEQKVCIVVKSFNEERMKANLQIFDWELSHEETEAIDAIPQHRGYRGQHYICPNSPYKSYDELWDGEI